MVRPALPPKQQQAALAELERVIARLKRTRASQLAAINRLAQGQEPATRLLALLHATEQHLTCLHEIRQALLARDQPEDPSEDVR